MADNQTRGGKIQLRRSFVDIRTPDEINDPQLEYRERILTSNLYGDIRIENAIPTKHVLADHDCYYCLTIGGPSETSLQQYNSSNTGLLPTSYLAANGLFALYNSSSRSQPTRIYLDYIKLIVAGTIPASPGTSVQCTHSLVQGIPAQVGSISIAGATPTTVNMDGVSNSVSTTTVMNAGSFNLYPILGTSPQTRHFGRCQLKGGPLKQWDEYQVIYGAVQPPASGGYLTSVPGPYVTYGPPIMVVPGETLIFNVWFPGFTGTGSLNYLLEMGWWER